MPMDSSTKVAARRVAPPRSVPIWPLLIGSVVVLGFVLRAWAALHPLDDPGPDSHTYELIADWLYKTGHFGTPSMVSPSDWSPGMPLFIAGIYKLIGGGHPSVARLVIALLGALTVLFVYLLGSRLAGRTAGLIAALAIAIYPTFVENSAQFLTEPLAAFLVIGALLSFLRAVDSMRYRWWLVTGIGFGLLALTRPEYMVFITLFGLVGLVLVVRSVGLWPGVLRAALIPLCAGAVIAPWTLHNYHELGKFVPISTGGGKAMFVATYLPGEGRLPADRPRRRAGSDREREYAPLYPHRTRCLHADDS
jgi:4-amino-4-deoxy-L-arabinose transferase-like glycosyltransferase